MSHSNQSWPKTTRQLAAFFQIRAAIDHFYKEEFECAVTLAAAAEGIIPDAKDEYLFTILNASKGLDLNAFQNWLKHGKYNGKYIDSIVIDGFIAVVSLQRAITKFVAVYEKEPEDMEDFINWCRDNGYPVPEKRP
jgi:hypothetical protein